MIVDEFHRVEQEWNQKKKTPAKSMDNYNKEKARLAFWPLSPEEGIKQILHHASLCFSVVGDLGKFTVGKGGRLIILQLVNDHLGNGRGRFLRNKSSFLS